MKKIRITDMTLRECANSLEMSLSFKEKLEIAKCLDKMRVDVIELPALENLKTDALLTRTISTTVKNCAVSITVGSTCEDVDNAWECIAKAAKPRLHVIVPLSTVQMEYVCRKKPDAVLVMIKELVTRCKSYCDDIDFTAEDATRSDPEFLRKAIDTAVSCGASTVTISDTAGIMLPDEFGVFISSLKENIPSLHTVDLAAQCMNEINMSAACAVSSVKAGAVEIKSVVSGTHVPTVSELAHIINLRGDDLGISCGINTMEMLRLTKQIEWMTRDKNSSSTPFDTGIRLGHGDDFSLNGYDTIEEVEKATVRLGYELSQDDIIKVYNSFKETADKKEVSAKELEAIIASVALQVPPTYRLVNFVTYSGNLISSSANIVMEKNGKEHRGLCAGDGPIDASFKAVEQIVGTHYELDDFQIQAVTEGHEAMGSAVVKLRSNGKLYSGSGISTDIIAAAINAYINAINKIVYEEN